MYILFYVQERIVVFCFVFARSHPFAFRVWTISSSRRVPQHTAVFFVLFFVFRVGRTLFVAHGTCEQVFVLREGDTAQKKGEHWS